MGDVASGRHCWTHENCKLLQHWSVICCVSVWQQLFCYIFCERCPVRLCNTLWSKCLRVGRGEGEWEGEGSGEWGYQAAVTSSQCSD